VQSCATTSVTCRTTDRKIGGSLSWAWIEALRAHPFGKSGPMGRSNYLISIPNSTMSHRVSSEMARFARGVLLKRIQLNISSQSDCFEGHGIEYGSYQIATLKNLSDNADTSRSGGFQTANYSAWYLLMKGGDMSEL